MKRKLIFCLALAVVAMSLPARADYASTVIADSPLSYFQFEDAASGDGNTCLDSMGLVSAQYRLRGSGPPIALVPGLATMGQAASFMGASGGDGTFVVIQDDGYTGDKLTNPDMSIELLMSTTADSGNYPTVVNFHDDNLSPHLSFGNYTPSEGPVQTFQPFVSACGATWYAWPPGILGDGDWHHYVVTFDYNSVNDETDIAMYMDSDLKGTRTHAGMITPNTTDTWKQILLGAAGNRYYVYNGYVGLMDEVAIYDYALTQGQVEEHYDAIPEPATIALLGLGGLALRRRKR